MGDPGVTGATGATGVGISGYAYAGVDIQTNITVASSGTNIQLFSEVIPSSSISYNMSTGFTIYEAGYYFIQYNVNLDDYIDANARMTVNGIEIKKSIVLGWAGGKTLNNGFIIQLYAGDVLQLQLFGVDGSVNLVEGDGASVSILRLS